MFPKLIKIACMRYRAFFGQLCILHIFKICLEEFKEQFKLFSFPDQNAIINLLHDITSSVA